MKMAIVFLAVALLAVLMGSALMRRGEWQINGESRATLLGLALSFVAVLFIFVALVGNLWS